jgi:hypothetical protein
MGQDIAKQSYRGVLCLSCRQPIPLPGIVATMELSLKSDGSDLLSEHHNRVFSLRCKACQREKPYSTSDIIDFEGIPTPRPSRSDAQAPGRRPLYRTANG